MTQLNMILSQEIFIVLYDMAKLISFIFADIMPPLLFLFYSISSFAMILSYFISGKCLWPFTQKVTDGSAYRTKDYFEGFDAMFEDNITYIDSFARWFWQIQPHRRYHAKRIDVVMIFQVYVFQWAHCDGIFIRLI